MLNTALSLSALGLWFFAPNRMAAPAPAVSVVPQLPPPQPPPRFDRFAQQPVGPTAPRPGFPEMGASAPRPVHLDPRGLSRTPNVNVTPATQALADRLHMQASALVQTFGDASGDLPRDVAKRLERAFDSATSLAKQRQLDETQTQALVTILTYYQFSVLREETSSAPAPVDPTRIEQMQEETLTDIQTTCGEETRKAAKSEIERW